MRTDVTGVRVAVIPLAKREADSRKDDSLRVGVRNPPTPYHVRGNWTVVQRKKVERQVRMEARNCVRDIIRRIRLAEAGPSDERKTFADWEWWEARKIAEERIAKRRLHIAELAKKTPLQSDLERYSRVDFNPSHVRQLYTTSAGSSVPSVGRGTQPMGRVARETGLRPDALGAAIAERSKRPAHKPDDGGDARALEVRRLYLKNLREEAAARSKAFYAERDEQNRRNREEYEAKYGK